VLSCNEVNLAALVSHLSGDERSDQNENRNEKRQDQKAIQATFARSPKNAQL
jgi:hypothetical protein